MAREKTKRAFAQAFGELAGEKAFDKITVGEICAKADRSPATFYRHFRDKYDLVAWEYARETAQIMSSFDGVCHTWVQTLCDSMEFHWSHRALLQNLLSNTNGLDSFVHEMTANCIMLLGDAVSHAQGVEELDSDIMLSIKIYSFGIIQLLCVWITGGFECTPEHLATIMEDNLPIPLRAVLLPQQK